MLWLAACGVIPCASAALRMLPSSTALAKAVMARSSLNGHGAASIDPRLLLVQPFMD